MERVRVNVGRFALGLVVLILVSMAVSSWRTGDARAAVVSGAFAAFLGYVVVFSRFEPDWRDEIHPPPSAIRTAVASIAWLGLGFALAFPETLMRGVAVSAGPRWLTWLLLAFFTLPAAAFLHLEFLSGLGAVERAKRRWGIGKLGPIGAAVYFLT
jgi:hypothetical protein